MEGLTVSQVARASNVHIETVRYYERRGLITEPPRSKTGYRMFAHAAVEEIQFIKRAQEVGFTLEEIKQVLSLYKDDDSISTEEMHHFALLKIQEIEARMIQLQQFKALLESVTHIPVPKLSYSKERCPVILKCLGKDD